MQVRKVAVGAAGALAAAAAMGSTPASAADNAGVPEAVPGTVGALDFDGTQRASDAEMRELAEHWLTVTPEQAWVPPWQVDPPQILSLGSGSAISALALQSCGSTSVDGVGTALPIASPNTVLGDCNNGNIAIADDGGDALFSILDNTGISIGAIQDCGSTAGLGGAILAPIASPNTVLGDCNNGNIVIGSPEGKGNGNGQPEPPPAYNQGGDWDDQGGQDGNWDGQGGQDGGQGGQDGGQGGSQTTGTPDSDYAYHQFAPLEADAPAADQGAATVAAQPAAAEGGFFRQAPWQVDPPQILSAGSGTGLSTGSLQSCGSTSVDGAGAAVPIASPNTVTGECNNGNVKIHGDGDDALFSLLSNTGASVGAIQSCGSTDVTGAGIAAPIASPNTVFGDCNNGNVQVG